MSLLIQSPIRENAESSFVNSFLENIKTVFPNKEFLIIQEAFAESGVPDIILVSWKKNNIPLWNDDRKNLKKVDLNILHYLYSKKEIQHSLSCLENILGYPEKILKIALNRLSKADLLSVDKDTIGLKKLNEIFFVDEIISIEAKLHNKKKVIHQAMMNQNFSSKSYVLMPKKKYRKSSSYFKEDSIGFMTFDGEETNIDRKPKESKIPGSAYSWILNEYVGKTINDERIKTTQ